MQSDEQKHSLFPLFQPESKYSDSSTTEKTRDFAAIFRGIEQKLR